MNCPPDPTPLELLADDAGLDPEYRRFYLREEIRRRELALAECDVQSPGGNLDRQVVLLPVVHNCD